MRQLSGTLAGGLEHNSRISQNGILYSISNQIGISAPYYGIDSDNQGIGLDSSLQVPTAVENRPVNMAVRYLIKALK
jgi:hypothetical protein